MISDEQLDRLLARSLRRPEPSPAFTARWRAALVEARGDDADALRERLERERREQLAAFRREFVRMRRRTFATCIGVAFVAGAAASAVMPWLVSHYGSLAELVVPLTIAVAGAAAGVLSAGRRFEL